MTGQVTIEEVRNGQVPKRKRAPNVTEEIFNEVWRLHDRFPKAMLTELSEMIRGKGMSPIGPDTISNIINRKSKTFEEYLQWKKEILEKSKRKKETTSSDRLTAATFSKGEGCNGEEQKEQTEPETALSDRLTGTAFHGAEGCNGGEQAQPAGNAYRIVRADSSTLDDVLRFEARLKLVENKQFAIYSQTQRILDRLNAIEKKLDEVQDDERRILGRMYVQHLEEAMEA